MSRKLVIGGFYRHFKDKLYRVIDVVYHSETKEPLVLYQALYGDFKSYVRPYDMFLSEVDHVKYPNVKDKYRFTLVEISKDGSLKEIDEDVIDSKTDTINLNTYNYYANDINIKNQDENAAASKENFNSNEKKIAALVERFLDSKEYEDKLDSLLLLRNNLNDDLIDVLAESLDVVVEKGSLDARFKSLKAVLEAHTKYEGGRLRR